MFEKVNSLLDRIAASKDAQVGIMSVLLGILVVDVIALLMTAIPLIMAGTLF